MSPVHRLFTTKALLSATSLLLAATACSQSTESQTAADQFLAAFQQHCGQAYAGRIAVNQPVNPTDQFAGQELIMHIRHCGEDELHIPFHVGENHSRTWIITRTDTGLRLKHDHRHEDGSEDVLTQYGGDTTEEGSASRQEFPVDQFSIDLFLREGSAASVTNVWAMEIVPGRQFVYELSRSDSDRLFRVEFDLTTSVATPPTPWGYEPL